MLEQPENYNNKKKDRTELIKKMSVPKGCNIRTAMQAISQGEIGTTFVIDEKTGKFEGLIMDGDIRRSLLKGHGLESSISVVDCSYSKIASTSMDIQMIEKMISEKVRLVPILNDQGCLVDIYYRDRRTKIAVAEPVLDEKELEYVTECVLSGWISSGGVFSSRFEKSVAKHCNAKHGIACSSGTSALHLVLLSAGLGSGDEVIVPTLSFIATANAVSHAGAKPIFVDSEVETWNIDPSRIVRAITPKTRAIIPVHLYGQPADMDIIKEIAKKHSLYVFEDAAEAQGAKYKGAVVGSLADAGIFSFYGNKIITTGEGGMIVTNDDKIAERARMFRDHGMSKKRRYWHSIMGYNYRMTNLQAALGVAQMEKIDLIIHKKKEIAKWYSESLKDVPGIVQPPKMDWSENVCWLYTILINKDEFGVDVESVTQKLEESGVDTRPVFPPIHKQPIYNTGQVLPVSEKLSSVGISLPSAPNLQKDKIKDITEIIKSCAVHE